MTNDVRKRGWAYKVRTDANHRQRRQPEYRNPVERFRRQTPLPERRCQSKAKTPHKGPLQVHHVGGLHADPRRQKFAWMCMRHNLHAAGFRGWFRQAGANLSARSRLWRLLWPF